MARTALIVGATGLVGSALLRLALDDGLYDRVHVLARRTTGVAHPRLVEHLVDFERLAQVDWPAVDDVHCCLGTTIRAAGSQPAFRQVDFDHVVGVARAALAAGARRFLMVSALGANPESSVFYNRVKGEAEQAVRSLAYECCWVLRPSLLDGPRKEFRAGERVTLAVLRPLHRLIPANIRPIEAADVARAMLACARDARPGTHLAESAEIRRIAHGGVIGPG